MDRHATLSTGPLVNDWAQSLVRETAEIERAGVGAAVITVHFTATESGELVADVNRATSLLRRRLRPTDRLGGIAERQLSILSTPLNELVEAITYVRRLDGALFDHRILAYTSFAYRRVDESLIDTWARSQAELDRVLYRELHGDGISV